MARSRVLPVVLLSLVSVVGWAKVPPPAPSFTVAAGALTMPSSGQGYITYTVTSVNGFAGTVQVTCTNPNPPVGVREPNCGNYGPAFPGVTLTANGTATGTINLTANEPLPVHEVSKLNRREGRGALSLALAGVLMLGFGLRRRKALRLVPVVLLVGMLVGVSGCGGQETLTPGVYTYTLTANAVNQGTPSVAASTTVTVTVPAGIVIHKGVPEPV